MDWQHVTDYALGNRDFDSLSSLEQEVALVHEFMILFEMEGFTHFFTYQPFDHVQRLVAFMERFGASNLDPIRRVVSMVQSKVPSWNQDEVDGFFCDLSDDVHSHIDEWGDEYYAGVERMWDELDDFLEQQGLPRRPTLQDLKSAGVDVDLG